jgi:hypothetical protein
MTATEIELRQAAIWLLQRQHDAGFKVEKESALRLFAAIQESQAAEEREQAESKVNNEHTPN